MKLNEVWGINDEVCTRDLFELAAFLVDEEFFVLITILSSRYPLLLFRKFFENCSISLYFSRSIDHYYAFKFYFVTKRVFLISRSAIINVE